MSELLKGWLTAEQQLTGTLSAVSGSPPVIRLIPKEITANGEYLPLSEGADGYSSIIADIHPGLLVPDAFDLDTGYVRNGQWTLGGDTVNYSDMYAVAANETYLIALGASVGTRFRSMFSVANTAEARENVAGSAITNTALPDPYARILYTPPSDGFITITKDNDGTAGLKTYVFSIRGLTA